MRKPPGIMSVGAISRAAPLFVLGRAIALPLQPSRIAMAQPAAPFSRARREARVAVRGKALSAGGMAVSWLAA